MNVTRENIDELSAVVSVSIVEEDYKEVVAKSLKDYRRKANVPGFRPGNVPMGMIQKMYGKSVLVDKVFNLAYDAVFKHIKSENIQILGEPIPSESGNQLNFDTETEFVVKYEIGYSPKIEQFINSDLSFELLRPVASVEKREQLIEQIRQEHGSLVEVESIEGKENLRGTFAELDANGNLVEGGISQEDALVSLLVVKDEETLAAFTGKKAGDVVKVDIVKSFPNEADRSALMGQDIEALNSTSGLFQFTITRIDRFTAHELNQDLFDKVWRKCSD
jgi:trigger factor